METVKLPHSASADRLQAAHRLQRRYQIAAQDIAFLLGLTAEAYQKRLKKAGLDAGASAMPVLDIEDLLIKINAELQNFSKAEGLPEKSAVEALAALAKAVKSISELSRETRVEALSDKSENQNHNGGVKPEDVREALSLISARIAELSHHN
ncbi:hypothetical protein P8H26_07220 [Pseudochrobactrum sp. sp1633]|uniref:hypothetical protein n=1 Tax=Pseudochrobactrum sp. sp1633 TaxID=3036706 RepID=UPI0025A5010E|nr:hypothetical protein [Pseudochrobactrum sp. sp1633]MDM8345181.1 hypothetical protein [Pseudochrobactrum sp. sp1633]HWD12968.1 hypothetical protein [Pseudochrobactrum sp.]